LFECSVFHKIPLKLVFDNAYFDRDYIKVKLSFMLKLRDKLISFLCFLSLRFLCNFYH